MLKFKLTVYGHICKHLKLEPVKINTYIEIDEYDSTLIERWSPGSICGAPLSILE